MVTCQSLELVTRHPDGFVSNLPADSDSDDAVAATRTPSRTQVTYPCISMYLSLHIFSYPYISMYLSDVLIRQYP